MLRERKNMLRLVVAFLAACAVIGFLMGIKGSLPRGAPPAAPVTPAMTTGEVIEAQPLDEAVLNPPAQPEPKAPPASEPQEEPDEEEAAPPPEPPKPAEKAPPPKEKAAPAPAPKPKPAPAPKPKAPPSEDPVGDLLEELPPDAVLY